VVGPTLLFKAGEPMANIEIIHLVNRLTLASRPLPRLALRRLDLESGEHESPLQHGYVLQLALYGR
jgi:hypothetical protein